MHAVTATYPAALMARDYHSLWLNSAALARANGDLQVPGGVVERDEQGKPTGVLREECAWHFRDLYVRPTHEEMVDASREGSGSRIPAASSRSTTRTAGSERSPSSRSSSGKAPSRCGYGSRFRTTTSTGSRRSASRLASEARFFRVGYIKAFMDGTLGSQTARMLDGSGVEITSRAELEDIVRRSARAGFPVAVHAIGNLANRQALDAFEATQDDWRPRGLRPRIEHAQLLAPEDVPRFAKLGVAASVQFSHAPSDRDLADRFWDDLTPGAYAYRSLLDAGAHVANGSDAPIEELDPLAGIAAGVLRTIDDRPAWHPEQRVTVEEAVHATCVAPAWLEGAERRRGRLVPGQLADLIVLDRDPFECPREELRDVALVATMAGGRWVHNPPPWD